jgi:hypothetical protein
MWIIWSVPLMCVAVAIAVVPVVLGSIHNHRVEVEGWAEVPSVGPSHREGILGPRYPKAEPVRTSVACSLCLQSMAGVSDDELVDMVERHAWQVHGIPSPKQVLLAAR